MTTRERSPDGVAFYVVADARHYLGAVAVLNSLRLVGHGEPVVLFDCGLSEAQRASLAPHAELVPAPPQPTAYHLKWAPPLARPAPVMALLDADVIVLRPLDELMHEAAAGKIVVFADKVGHRFDPRWGDLLGLGPVRRQTYANAGVILAEGELGRDVFSLVQERQETVDVATSRVGSGRPSDPFYYLDQDVFNAVLATRVAPERLAILEQRLAPHPPFAGLDLVDERTLTCRYGDGAEPYVLHHVLAKPWLTATRWNVYASLLARVLLAPDVALRLAPHQLPLRLRRGALAWVDRRRSDAVALLRAQRGRLGIRRRLAARRSEAR